MSPPFLRVKTPTNKKGDTKRLASNLDSHRIITSGEVVHQYLPCLFI